MGSILFQLRHLPLCQIATSKRERSKIHNNMMDETRGTKTQKLLQAIIIQFVIFVNNMPRLALGRDMRDQLALY